ncbi:hypothetical protein C4K08_4638 [Pseudomonas chlororaphis subsp. aureofaciens]|nr:hypothetical protein C4K08_4638 [Pseudomonas chlororaphis subsp. aureofaciens]
MERLYTTFQSVCKPDFLHFHRLCSCLGIARNLPGWSANG